jgi:hypothetical protein
MAIVGDRVAVAASSASVGRRPVYTAWTAHLTEDWRSVALLAARVGLDEVVNSQRKRAHDLLRRGACRAFESTEDPMPDHAYRHALLPGRHTKARRLLVDRALGDDSTNNPRLVVDPLLSIDHNGASRRLLFASVHGWVHSYQPSTRPDIAESS